MPVSLEENLRSLSLSCFLKRYIELASLCEAGGKSHVEYLSMLTCEEVENRARARIDKLLKEARLPRNKHLEDFEIGRITGLSKSLVEELSRGDFIEKYENILIFGNPGTGKTHLSIGLARRWCLEGRRVYYSNASHLVQDLLQAKQEMKLKEKITKLDKYEVLLIDDISYITFAREETDVLFQLLADRYERRSTLITSNLPFGRWSELFKDEMTTAAVIDRLVHHSVILELNAESYRMAKAKSRKKEVSHALVT